jgi:membrane protein YdbS with pleckstrin-like domain
MLKWWIAFVLILIIPTAVGIAFMYQGNDPYLVQISVTLSELLLLLVLGCVYWRYGK